MHIRQEFEVNAPQQKVWDFLMDAMKVGECMPGVEKVEPLGDNTYGVVVSVKVGPIKPHFKGEVQITDVFPPDRMLVRLDWKDSVTGSKVGAPAEINLSTTPTGAVAIAVEGKITVLGILGKYGQPIAERKAAEITKEFAERVRAELEDHSETQV